MEISALVSVLDQPHLAADHLHGWGLRDAARGRQVLLEIADSGLTLDLLANLCGQLAQHLPPAADPDAVLDAFCRYLLAVRSPLALAALCERDASAMPLLLAALSLGPRWTELLIGDPEAFDLLRQTRRQPTDEATLLGEIQAELESIHDEPSIVAVLTRFRQRQLLRIAYGELAEGGGLEAVIAQLSRVAEAIVEAALGAALRRASEIKPLPSPTLGRQVRCSVIATGSLGAGEASYALTLPLLVVYDAAAPDATAQRAVQEHFDRVAKTVQRLIQSSTGDEVRLLALPDSPIAAAAHAAEDVVVGFDSFGRTWHRQEMLKARTVAGDRGLGQEVLGRLQTWLFRRYLGRADETGIKALKRRIVLAATLHQDDWRNVRLARGGLRNIESTVEFLQLLAGGDQSAVRQSGTLAAIRGLQAAAALTADESFALEEGYVFLRRLEHRLQILLGPHAVELPADDSLVERIAAAMGHGRDAAAFAAELQDRLSRTWQPISKLLTSAFPEEPTPPREVELLLDPAPPLDEVRAALAPFGFEQPQQALAMLNELAAEQVPFLSTRRCRHWLAATLPRLLCAVGATPRPDRTLAHLARVSNSLGAKGVLWELCRASPPTLDLYVKLCAASPYLSDILTTNPGMIDELLDSLQLDKLPTRAELQATLGELCRGTSDTLPIVHDFKNAEHLRIGVRDVLGKEDIDASHAALADVAETCLTHVAELENQRLVEKFGQPTIGPGAFEGEPCRFVIVGLGKLGGREPNYHSHLDVLFLYEADGTTRPPERWRRIEQTANNHFFTQLAQRITKQLSQHTAKGRLYPVDALLRPIGVGGALALTFVDFVQHFAGGAAPLWQWQALCQARPVFGEPAAARSVANLIRQLLVERPPRQSDAAEMRQSRAQAEKGTAPHNLKRAPGGTLDVEFLVQMLQLQHAAARPAVLTTNTQAALTELAKAGALPAGMAHALGESYRFLRRVESGLRLMNTSARHDLPADDSELAQLAYLLGHGNPHRLRDQCLQAMAENRAAFDELV
jgi:glutamate-ammonia-ligase adenylyltransferase